MSEVLLFHHAQGLSDVLRSRTSYDADAAALLMQRALEFLS